MQRRDGEVQGQVGSRTFYFSSVLHLWTVEINTQMRTSKRLQGSQPPSLGFGETRDQAERWESFLVKKKKKTTKGFGLLGLEGVGKKKLEAGSLEARSCMWLVLEAYLLS